MFIGSFSTGDNTIVWWRCRKSLSLRTDKASTEEITSLSHESYHVQCHGIILWKTEEYGTDYKKALLNDEVVHRKSSAVKTCFCEFTSWCHGQSIKWNQWNSAEREPHILSDNINCIITDRCLYVILLLNRGSIPTNVYWSLLFVTLCRQNPQPPPFSTPPVQSHLLWACLQISSHDDMPPELLTGTPKVDLQKSKSW